MSYEQRIAEKYDKHIQTEDEETQRLIDESDRKLMAIVKEYSPYFTMENIKILIILLDKKNNLDKVRSDVNNILYDLEALATEHKYYSDDPYAEMLDTLKQIKTDK
ncbi:hypothetical protein YY92_08285 [Campylobacter fetus]|uniref:hypothetical protein n=1 Tax=Campylobacter fetus TaxID=196 RepID=UPI0011CB4DB9|nr:hypothetical protein [Campylobacter fetus]EAJ1232614.1 hypothetical protein [Campylobacter fetus]EAK0414707.1 hypothetical protein [Campylobacter fetus]TXF09177.1 hypothetical protein FPD25_03320 [Campylobacter fetus subsp. fetus]